MKLVQKASALRSQITGFRGAGARVALVPTMGALHEGHLSLVRKAAQEADRVIVSIFVNPAQFAPHEDFERYPRDLDADCATLETSAADLVFAPAVEEIYPAGFASRVDIGGPGLGLESDFRPHFFSGVATVVLKLLVLSLPDVAVFGEKDYQQLLVVRQLVRDLSLPVVISGAPIVREFDGLALSSRNAYLSKADRGVAGRLNGILKVIVERSGSEPVPLLESFGVRALLDAGFSAVDYVAIRDAETLAPLTRINRPARVLAAARIGNVRLIDNMAIASAMER